MSRDLTKLSPNMQGKARLFLAECHRQNLDIVIICTDRSDADQAACYASGASNAKPGQSAHNAKDKQGNPASEAFDVGVIRAGKYIGNGKDPDYIKAGSIGESVGLAWAGRWTGKIKEVAHFQNPEWSKP
jgi:peptidoglycan L-alanyl-D-glutamate endopeptidase CwlK